MVGLVLMRVNDPQHHADVAGSELIEVIEASWALNTIRPSDVTGP